jgi:NAD(P)-dependent dehydrogenase (short-subunit alcohol dehydrogenase family)
MISHLEKLYSLDGMTAVVTGGTGVLGGAMVHGLARAGAKVGVLGRRRDRAESVVARNELHQPSPPPSFMLSVTVRFAPTHAALPQLSWAW